MMSGFGWAKHPIVNRIDKLHKDVPITLLYGSRSWVDNSAGEVVKEKRTESFVNLQVKYKLLLLNLHLINDYFLGNTRGWPSCVC